MNYPLYTSNLKPSNRFVTKGENASYALLEDYYLQGGYRVCADITERNAITYDRRKVGMMVHTLDDDKYWILINEPAPEPPTIDEYYPDDPTPTTDTDWEEFSSAGNWLFINTGETSASNLEGFPAGTVLPSTGITLEELWTRLLFPVVTPYFYINPDSYFVVSSGETVTFELLFFGNWETKDWIISTNADWTTLSVTGGTGNTTFDVVCEPNTGVTSNFRKAVITVTANGTEYEYCYIEQFGDIGTYFVNPDPTTATNLEGIPAGSTFPIEKSMQEMWDLLLYPYIASWYVTPPERVVSFNSGSTTFDIEFTPSWTGSTAWFIQDDVSWCTLVGSSLGTGDTTFTVTYDSNLLATAVQRTANITVILQGTLDARTVRVVQQAPTYPIPTISFEIDSPYLYDVGESITGKTGTWSTTNTISIVPNSVRISGPQLTTITGLTYNGSTELDFVPDLYETGTTSVGPWTATADTVFGSVITGNSSSISWDLKIIWGLSSGQTITESDILSFSGDTYYSQYYAGYPIITETPSIKKYFYLCIPNIVNFNLLNWLNDQDWVGFPVDMHRGYTNKYTTNAGHYISYDTVNVTINGNIYVYKVYRSSAMFSARVSALLYLQQ